MKKVFIRFSILILFLIVSLIVVLSTTGIETNKLNNLISKKIKENNKNIFFKFEKIKFKFDVKDISLFVETNNPEIDYKNTTIPLKNIKVYLDLITLIKSQPKIEKVILLSNELDINDLKKISVKLKPSNITSFINNKIKKGKINAEIELYFKEDLDLINFIAKGEVKEIETVIGKNINLKKTNFNFLFDESDILIKNINGQLNDAQIRNGDIRIEKENKIKIQSSFESFIDTNEKNIKNYLAHIKGNQDFNEQIKIKANLNNIVNLVLDKTYKIEDYQIKSQGRIKEFNFSLDSPIKSPFLVNDINKATFKETKTNIRIGFDKKNTINFEGKYKLNNQNYQNYIFKYRLEKNNANIDINFNFSEPLNINFINYQKKKNIIAEISTNFDLKNDIIFFKKIDYKENKNLILLENLKIKKKNLESIKKFKIKTFYNNKLNNDFSLDFGKIIYVKGQKYDATNLNKILNQKTKNDFLKKISKKVDINLKKIQTPLADQLYNFKLLGTLKNGKFIKISSKGDFGNNKYLDISLKNDNNNKKFLEIYSDIPQALLSEYSFFKGLSGGKLTFSSIIDKDSSTSKLLIENFKIVNAPGVVKLLSLADFGGLADLAEGEGLSFEKLDLNMTKDKNILKLNELFAVGPSISVLMDGYQDANSLTSLRGTLVPAKNLNNLLSKIPVIGDIIIPKEVGEGLFGVSFKMKGPPGKIKTTINPIKTLTPRFISKALERSKKN